MRAQVMLEKSSKYEVVGLEDKRKVLVLFKSTETEDPFVVVAGYYLKQTGDYEERVLAEIETVPVSEYTKLKKELRGKDRLSKLKNAPITFW